MPLSIQIRQIKYLNNIVEQNHRFIKKRIRSMLEFKFFRTAICILIKVEAIHMIKKEQVDLRNQSVQNQKEFIHQLFGMYPVFTTEPLIQYKKTRILSSFCIV